jgi:hypothetical protein
VFAVLDGPVRTEDGERPDIDRRIPIAGRIASAAGAALTVRKEFRFDGNEPIVRFLG